MKKFLSILLCVTLIMTTLTGCDISSKHLEVTYEENDNPGITDWDSVDETNVIDWDTEGIVTTWEDVEDYSDWVYASIVFDDIAQDYPIIECTVLDYRTNGQYFDGEKVYRLVGDKFDVNTFAAKYAVGSGVIIICVVLNIATAGGTTPICCFFAGAAEGATSMAVKGAAFNAAMNAVSEALKGGDYEDVIYGALEGSADGYMWGAIYGSITGGWNSKYCFTEGTAVLTETGYIDISDIQVGMNVMSYNEDDCSFEYKKVLQVMDDIAYETALVSVGDEVIESTFNHPYLTNRGWVSASNLVVGDQVYANNNDLCYVTSVEYKYYEDGINIYNIAVEDNHCYLVGENELVVHNQCNKNTTAYEENPDHRYRFPEGTPNAEKYPNGVLYSKDANGKVWARFEEYSIKEVKFEYPSAEALANNTCLRGNASSDFAMADKAAGFTKDNPKPAGYTWHHCEDGQTMLLVPQDVHSVIFGGAAHTGGESVIKALLGF